MNRLWVRLALAFGLVIISGIGMAAWLANGQISSQFRRFVMHDQLSSLAVPALADFYAQNTSWVGVETVLAELPSGGMGMGQGRGQGQGMMMGRGGNFTLVDASGHVIDPATGQPGASRLDQDALTGALPIAWQGQTVGYVLPNGPGPSQLPGSAQTFLNQINRALLQAGLIAGAVGLVAGILIARGISAPLSRLAVAARYISEGKFDQRVSPQGSAEISDLAHAFNDMAVSLDQAETLRRNLVADIAHELRTPLSVVQGNLQAILDGVYPLEKAEIAAIYEETLVLNRLVSDLRQLAQAEAGQLGLDLQPVEIGPIIQETANLFGEPAGEKQLQITVSLPAALPPVLIDVDRTRQVLHNLLANAVRHTPAGGQISLTAKAAPATVEISVSDTGSGIAPLDLPLVFDRFWRADKSRSREQGGSGLGLAIARQLVEAQGGTIGVASEGQPGRGSRFWFTLPVA
ncbi:MAG: HAMP domain-containing protein, partial [Anaerolineae bacterium]|nr:HAMP domain-containing protein [Anaerolineae bacterium]